MTKKYTLFLFACFFLGIQQGNAQSSVSDFILTAFEDINTQGYDESLKFLSPRNYRLPIVEDLELRFGNNEFTHQDQQYALRFRPGNPWRIRRNNALFNATRKELTIRKKLQYKENLEDRYELASEYLIESQLFEINQKHYSIIAKGVEILGTNMESSLFDAKDYVDAKLDQVDALSKQEDARISMMRFEKEIIAILQQPEFDWSSSPMISVSTIDNLADNIISNTVSSLELDLITQRIDVAKKELRLEKADFNLGFIQTEYFPYRNKSSDYGVSFGVSIPLFKSNKNQIAERRLDEIELKNDLNVEQYQDSVQRIIEYEYLKNLITQHQILIDNIAQLDLDKLSKNLSQIEDNNPLTLLKLQEGSLKLKELQAKSYKRIIDQYLEFLSRFNALSQLPLTNYLSENLDRLE